LLDALLYAVRDNIRAAGMQYGFAECEIMEDGKPPPRAGNWFVAIHGGKTRPGAANSRNLDELFDFSATLTGRVTVPLDRIGDQLIARNIPLRDTNDVPLALRQGFDAKMEQLRGYLHMNWKITVSTGQTPNSANDNLIAWGSGTGVYGFVEPARYQGGEVPTLVGGDWLGSEPEVDDFALKAELRFAGARRFQPQTASVGAFV
jgi:hypothetical protein